MQPNTSTQRIFGQMTLDFTQPCEFALPPQLLQSVAVAAPIAQSSTAGTGGGDGDVDDQVAVDWLSNLPASLLFGDSERSSSTGPTAGGLMSVISPNAKWPVLNLPVSSKKALLSLSIEGGGGGSANKSNSNNSNKGEDGNGGGNYSAASLLFRQMVAAENARRGRGAGGGATSSSVATASSSSSSSDRALLSYLLSGLDPNEAIPVDVTPTQLMFALGELQRRFDGDAAAADNGSSDTGVSDKNAGNNAKSGHSSGLSTAMRTALVSEEFVRLLAWQRLGQIIKESDAVVVKSKSSSSSAAGATTTTSSGTSSGSSGSSGVALPPVTATDSTNTDAIFNTDGHLDHDSVANRIELFRALGGIMRRGVGATAATATTSTSTGTATASSSSAVVSFASRSTQCAMVVAGLNTTLPFADNSKLSEEEVRAAAAASSSASVVVGEKLVDLNHLVSTSGGLHHSSTSSGSSLSPVVLQIWNLKRGLLGARVVGNTENSNNNNSANVVDATSTTVIGVKRERDDGSSASIDDDGSSSSPSAADPNQPKLLRIRLPYGVTTIGHSITEGVQIAVGGLLLSADGTGGAAEASSSIAAQHVRILVVPNTVPVVKDATTNAAAVPCVVVKVMACGEGASAGGLRVDGCAPCASPSSSSSSAWGALGGRVPPTAPTRWLPAGNAVAVSAGQTVRFGPSLAMTYRTQ